MKRLTLLATVAAVLLAATPLDAGKGASAYQRSYELEAAGNYQGAIDALMRAPSNEQSRYVFQLRLGWLNYLAGRLDRSIQSYRRAVGQAPAAIEPRLGLMLPLMAARRWLEAGRVGREVLDRDPKSYLARSRLAFASYSAGRYDEAASLYASVLADYPADAEMLVGLGWAQLKAGKRTEATRTFRAVVSFAPGHPQAQAGLRASNGGMP